MIRVLDKTVADKIAAGEVIDRPVSIVKELVENALDADAGSIVVEIRKGGAEYLRVTDDGCGIPGEETELAFRRHATSKISTESDLDAIRSLGFRGEALASICAVARVDMITKTRDAHTGRHVVCEGSEVLSNTATGCPDGTTITVRDLFYNVPARRKFLATDGAEARRIIDLMSRIALAYPDVRFRLINGNKEVFRTTGKGSILDNIQRVYGREMSRDLVPVDASGKGMILRGFVSSPGTSATSRSREFFCVNGRTVTSRVMEHGLERAYRERLFTGRFPIAFLFLQLPADQLDVNVHPTKKEIRFDDDFAVEDFIAEAVSAALDKKKAIPVADAAKAVQPDKPDTEAQEPAERTGEEKMSEDPATSEKPKEIRGSILPQEPEGEQVDIKNILQTMRQETQLKESETVYEADAPEDKEEKAGSRLRFSELEVIGVVFQTYILASAGDTLYLIDQHAAHERIFYEQLLAQYHSSDKLSQQLLIPLQISVSAEVEHAEELWIGYLRDMGYDIECFGTRMYIVRAIPAFAREGDAERFLRDLMTGLEQGPDIHSFASLDRLITRSCKSAVKGGDVLHSREIAALLAQLDKCDNPWSCPHGRPTVIRMTKGEIERMFKR